MIKSCFFFLSVGSNNCVVSDPRIHCINVEDIQGSTRNSCRKRLSSLDSASKSHIVAVTFS